jgi:tRNA (cmo5U34)-methyltransferase
MGQFHWDADTYMELMAAEVPRYGELQDTVAAESARCGFTAARILDLGTGTGETALAVLARHPGAHLTGIDASDNMLAVARERLPGADLRVGDLAGPLPEGPFDLVVSVLAVHHLDGPGKSGLFSRVARSLRPGGRFVLGDVVVPDDPADAITPIDPDYDLPDPVQSQIGWMTSAGLEAHAAWVAADLAVLVAQR